ncbi:UNVERIFIED_CONTAM: Zn-dependent M32 family carboxypeptidase [Brevibacillus sp. OAP136]
MTETSRSLETTCSLESEFLQYIREMRHLHEVLNLMFWDSRIGAPQKGLALRAEVIGNLRKSIRRFTNWIHSNKK